MLILSRHAGESITIGADVQVKVLGIKGNQIRLGVTAPRNIPVHREEVAARIAAEKVEAMSQPPIQMRYCTCAFYDREGFAHSGSPCPHHPQGCEHGKNWDEPCSNCRDHLWGSISSGTVKP